MPRGPWVGYRRFCPLARALDVVGERWTLVIVQELQKRPMRYGDLLGRLPGIGTSVLADRLRKLQAASVVERSAGSVGEGTTYRLTDRGQALEPALRALREWGAEFLFDPQAEGAETHAFDIGYVRGAEQIPDGSFELRIDGRPTALSFADRKLVQRPSAADDAELRIETNMAFLRRWAAGKQDWDAGMATGDVRASGPEGAWVHWLAATGYLISYPPEERSAPHDE
jgi:DNA-binding HxlR family transcriptional regulator